MNMHLVDWSIVGALLTVICFMAFKTRNYTRSVADFLAANRCAGKYLLGVADGIAGLCAISVVALFEMHYKAGFTAIWWATMTNAVWLVIALTGWVQYRYRETRALTMAQFFELRYSRRFRIFAGFLAFVSGAINFGIFPAVGGRFFQYFCGLPSYFITLGPIHFDLVYAAIMFFLLLISVAFAVIGGQIAVMVTDFIQGVFCNVMFVVIAVYVLYAFNWSVLAEGMSAAPANASLINPMKTGETDSYNLGYFLIAVFGICFTFMGWQGNQGYFGAAKSAHEQMMGRVISSLRILIQMLPLVLLPVCAFTFLHHNLFAEGAARVNQVLSGIGNEQLRSQLTVTVALGQFLPVGIMGGFAAFMVAAFISTHDTYLHSWGSIFIQDVLLPIRQIVRGDGQPLSPQAHLRWLRYSIVGVAIFIFLFSLFFNQKQDILMFFALTGTIFLGWSGAAIVGGLYWKKGTTAGAWAAAVLGIILAVVGWYMTYFWSNCKEIMVSAAPSLWSAIVERWPAFQGGVNADKCPINAQVLWFYTMLVSALGYILFSLLPGQQRVANMDRLLHRGAYAIEADGVKDKMPRPGLALFGMGSEFSIADKIIYIFSYGYVLVFFGVFLFGTLYAASFEVPDSSWVALWKIFGWVMLPLMVVLTVWLALGGIRDLRDLFQRLSTVERDVRDDGSVIDHRNLDEVADRNAESFPASSGEVPEIVGAQSPLEETDPP